MEPPKKSFLRHTVRSLKPSWRGKPSPTPHEIYEDQLRKEDEAHSQALAGARSAALRSPEPTNMHQMQPAHRERPEVHPQKHLPPVLRKPLPAEPTEKSPRRKRFRSRRKDERERRRERSRSAKHRPPILPQVPNVAESLSMSSQDAESEAVGHEEESGDIGARVRHSQDDQSREESEESRELREFLDRVFRILRSGKNQYTSIQFEQDIVDSCTLQTVEKALVDIFSSYGKRIAELDASESHAERLAHICRSSKDIVDGLKHKNEDLASDIEELISENKELTKKISTLETDAAEQATNEKIGNAKLEGRLSSMEELYNTHQEKHDARIVKIQADHQSEKNKLQADYQYEKNTFIVRIERLEAQISEMRRKCEDDIRDLKDDHSKKLAIARQTLDETNRIADDELAKAKREHGNRLAELTRTLENRIHRKEELLEQTKKSAGEKLAKAKSDHESELAELTKTLENRIHRKEELLEQTKKSAGEKLAKAKSDHENELAELTRTLENRIHRWEELLEQTKKSAGEELAKAKNDHENELAERTRTSESQLIQHDLENKLLLEKTERIASGKLEETKTHYENKLVELRSSLAQLESEHQEQLADLEGRRQLDLDNLYEKLSAKDREIDAQKQSFVVRLEVKDREIAEREQIYERKRSKMVQKHMNDKIEYNTGIRETVETLKEALVARDSFSAMSDHELKNRFRDVAVEVGEFARIRWDQKQELSWPFPRQYLEKLKNERRTKKNLIQNNLWVILYESIFCTPFRVLGREGKALEDEWRGKFGEAQNDNGGLARCPQPSKESERWRYETMQRCIMVTGERLVEGDPSFILQRSYDQSLEKIRNDIMHELGKVSTDISDYKSQIEILLKEAAKLWLEVGQQRCRMFLVMSESGTEPTRSGLNHSGPLNLVVMPQLRRMGNALGEQLNKSELVSEGSFSVFHTT